MRRSRFTEEQIIGILQEYEAGARLCRRHNVSQTTLYNLRAKFGGMTVSDAKQLKGLEGWRVNHKAIKRQDREGNVWPAPSASGIS